MWNRESVARWCRCDASRGPARGERAAAQSAAQGAAAIAAPPGHAQDAVQGQRAVAQVVAGIAEAHGGAGDGVGRGWREPGVLSKSLYGRRSEQQAKPHSTRRRGQQPGVRGHGRKPRPVGGTLEVTRRQPRRACVAAAACRM